MFAYTISLSESRQQGADENYTWLWEYLWFFRDNDIHNRSLSPFRLQRAWNCIG